MKKWIERYDWPVILPTCGLFAYGLWLITADPQWGEKVFGKGSGVLWSVPGIFIAIFWAVFIGNYRPGGYLNVQPAIGKKEGVFFIVFRVVVEEIGYRLPLSYASPDFWWLSFAVLAVVFAALHKISGPYWWMRFLNFILLAGFFTLLLTYGGLISAVICHFIYNVYVDEC